MSIYYDSNAVLPLVKLSIYDPIMVEIIVGRGVTNENLTNWILSLRNSQKHEDMNISL